MKDKRELALRLGLFLAGCGQIVFSLLTIRHFFLANFPATIFRGSFCDFSAFFNCDSSAFSPIAHFQGVPLGYFGLIIGIVFCLGSVFPSPRWDRTNSFLSFWNLVGVVGLLLYSLFYLKSLCLLCSGYYFFSIIAFVLWLMLNRTQRLRLTHFTRPSLALLFTLAIFTASGAFGFHLFYQAKKEAHIGRAMKAVKEFYELPYTHYPSLLSPAWIIRSTERFEEAPIQLVVYGDFLCPDCQFLARQLEKMKEEFPGKINALFQFFPLENRCNQVVNKNLHPGSCDLSYLAAYIALYRPEEFPQIHHEIFANMRAARSAEWRLDLARKYEAEEAFTDPNVQSLVHQIIETGKEYERTSERYPYGIRSTPTVILNNRMIIGTLPDYQLRAIFEALIEEKQTGSRRFLENWVPLR
ncbi:MAG: thioredoxin domain-containing protein [Candidatus Aminicenantes bacterium]|nr:thioredoxin domain-containing protein [Candidatus Aminicenantes bacterium]